MTLIYQPIAIARQFRFVREASPNRGLRVEAIQKWSGGAAGDSWCAQFATMVLDICFQGKSPIPRWGVVQDIYNLAKQYSWVTSTPNINDLFLYVNADDHAHHVGFVTGTDPLVGIAGNTSEDGGSSNGTGVFEHKIKSTVFVKYPR